MSKLQIDSRLKNMTGDQFAFNLLVVVVINALGNLLPGTKTDNNFGIYLMVACFAIALIDHLYHIRALLGALREREGV